MISVLESKRWLGQWCDGCVWLLQSWTQPNQKQGIKLIIFTLQALVTYPIDYSILYENQEYALKMISGELLLVTPNKYPWSNKVHASSYHVHVGIQLAWDASCSYNSLLPWSRLPHGKRPFWWGAGALLVNDLYFSTSGTGKRQSGNGIHWIQL